METRSRKRKTETVVVEKSSETNSQSSQMRQRDGPAEPDQTAAWKSMMRQTRWCALKALSYYNDERRKEKLPEYKLVKPVLSDGDLTRLPSGLLSYAFHVNFEAKAMKIRKAPVEMFFAEVLLCAPKTLDCTFCCSLGVSDPAASELKGVGHAEVIRHPHDFKCQFNK